MSDNKQRLLSLDVMRGITIAAMILVNTPGSWEFLYAPLSHAAWNGLTPTDVIFPFFLFMVGVAMTFGLNKLKSIPFKNALYKIWKRAFLLMFIGWFIHALPGIIAQLGDYQWSQSRIPGVLQRIGLAYGITATIAIKVPMRHIAAICVSILLAYWGILYLNDDPLTLSGNIVRDVDIALFGESHIWAMHGPQGKVPFDPEGLLSTLPSLVTVFIGLWAGIIVKNTRPLESKMVELAAMGTLLVLLGLAWHGIFPINKALWSSSYVLVTGGIAMLILFLLTWAIDFKGWKSWTSPFVVYGSNALFVYCLAEFWAGSLWTFIKFPNSQGEWTVAYLGLWDSIFQPTFGNHLGSLVFAIIHVLVFWMILIPLYKKRIFIKI